MESFPNSTIVGGYPSTRNHVREKNYGFIHLNQVSYERTPAALHGFFMNIFNLSLENYLHLAGAQMVLKFLAVLCDWTVFQMANNSCYYLNGC